MDLGAVRRVVVAHNPVGAEDDPSTADVLAQVELVEAGLDALGLPHERVAVADWKPWLQLRATPGTVVFNLVEAPPGRPHVQPASAAALDLLGLPYTGSPPPVLWITTDKLAMRALFASEGLPVAPGGRLDLENPEVLDRVPGPWILKPSCEDASVGLEGDPVCRTREEALVRGRLLARRFPDQAVVVESYLPGRELNASLLAKDGGVQVLPVAEIVFEGFPEGMSRVVNYEAKWVDDSFDCIHTVRRFPRTPRTPPCSSGSGRSRKPSGGSAVSAATPGSTCAWTRTEIRISWRRTRTPASPRTPASWPRRPGRGSRQKT